MKGLKRLAVVISLLFLVGCSEKVEVKQSRTEFLMNTVANISIYDSKDEEIMGRAYDRLFQVENTMSKTISKSEISEINRNAGIKGTKVSEATYDIIEKSLEYAKITEGSFDPTIGPLVNLWQIVDGEENRNWIPSENDIEEAKGHVDYEKLRLENGLVFLEDKDMELDLGGIAKGYGADEARRVLLEAGVKSALVDLGGNIYAVGEKTNKEAWSVGIKDPDGSGTDYLGIIKVKDKSIVTSGGYERFFKIGDKVYHHIIDPRTGYPSKSNIKSVSIISDSSTEGDALATSLYIMGLEKSKELIKNFDLGVIIVTEDKEVYVSKNISEDFKLTAKNYKLKTLD